MGKNTTEDKKQALACMMIILDELSLTELKDTIEYMHRENNDEHGPNFEYPPAICTSRFKTPRRRIGYTFEPDIVKMYQEELGRKIHLHYTRMKYQHEILNDRE